MGRGGFALPVSDVERLTVRYRDFAVYNVAGASLWVISMTVLGYFLGAITIVEENLEKVIILIVLASILPAAYEWWKARRAPAAAAAPESTTDA